MNRKRKEVWIDELKKEGWIKEKKYEQINKIKEGWIDE